MSENIKEALEYAVDLAVDQKTIYELKDKVFYDSSRVSLAELEPIKYAETLEVNSLTGLVGYLKDRFDEKIKDHFPNRLLIHVESPTKVRVLSSLNANRKRESLIQAAAILNRFPYGEFLDQERFKIGLQSLFVRNDDADAIMRFASAIKVEDGAEIKDNGVSQTVTVRTGASTIGQGEVPSPAVLKPYRTFLEVDQPESQFIFRIQEGPRLALFEADGGLWKYEAMNNIKEYLEKELAEEIKKDQLIIIA